MDCRLARTWSAASQRMSPARPQRELRDVTRYRSSLAADRARLVNRIQKTLEDTNIKLASVATDITGKSARAILEAMLEGEQDPQKRGFTGPGADERETRAIGSGAAGDLGRSSPVFIGKSTETIGLLDLSDTRNRSRDCSSIGFAKRSR
jgi:hypothetical protein